MRKAIKLGVLLYLIIELGYCTGYWKTPTDADYDVTPSKPTTDIGIVLDTTKIMDTIKVIKPGSRAFDDPEYDHERYDGEDDDFYGTGY